MSLISRCTRSAPSRVHPPATTVWLICLAMWSASALAQQKSDATTSTGDPANKFQTADKSPPAPQAHPGSKTIVPNKLLPAKGADQTKSGAKAKKNTARRPTKKRPRPKTKFQMNPNAKWACAQQTATLEPVWRGSKTVTFNFDIRNEGTADLLIKAKGG